MASSSFDAVVYFLRVPFTEHTSPYPGGYQIDLNSRQVICWRLNPGLVLPLVKIRFGFVPKP